MTKEAVLGKAGKAVLMAGEAVLMLEKLGW
jgi:hypothetical protein